MNDATHIVVQRRRLDLFEQAGLAEASAALCDRAEVVRMDEGTHPAHRECAGDVNARVIGFLNSPQPGAGGHAARSQEEVVLERIVAAVMNGVRQ